MHNNLLEFTGISKLREFISKVSTDLSAETNDRNLGFIASLANPAKALSIVREVIDDDMLLSRIASFSYRHINHFDKIVLVENDDPHSYRLTLHLWQPPYTDSELKQELIHDHRFNFWSGILTGNLVSENFQLSESGAQFRKYRYTPELRAEKVSNFYEFGGHVNLAKTTMVTRRAGEAYFLSAPSIHRISLPLVELTCSIVLRGPRLREFSTVYNTEYPQTNTVFDNVMFTPEQLRQKLTVLASSLEGGLLALRDTGLTGTRR